MWIKLIKELGKTFAEINVNEFNNAILDFNFQIDYDNTSIDIDDNMEESKEIFFDYFGNNFKKDYKLLIKMMEKTEKALGIKIFIDGDFLHEDGEVLSAKWDLSMMDGENDILINWTE